MARIDLKFLCIEDAGGWIKAEKQETQADEYICIELYNSYSKTSSTVYLDKSTAIKFAKTLRTEINKIKD